jgi:hypothetical protein
MALKGKVARLQKLLRGSLESFELQDGRRYYFDPEEAYKATFLYFTDSMTADYGCKPRPEPPEVLRAVADAGDRVQALSRVMGDYSHLPIDREALVERGEFVPRPLVASQRVDEFG